MDVAIKSMHVAELTKQLGEKDMLKAVTGAILVAAEYFNVKGGINESQAVQTASLWIEQYPLETFEDLLLCLKNAKLGKYGIVYNRIDGQTIFEWFRAYLDEKYERFEQMKKQEKMDAMAESEVFIGLAAKVLSNKPKAEECTSQISHESHLQKFKEMLADMGKHELLDAKRYYLKQNSQTLSGVFQDYIDLINEAILLK
ncbi:MAG: hypothetical protein K0B15_07295 [Lentimicrobium sp.]|nr:hypothetical protein [Lentimicrobium sp.]